MRWSYTIGRIAGTEVKIHVTFLLLLAWIAYTAYQDAGTAAAVSDTLFFVCFFFCILLHEFGHIRMARRFGVRTPDVILLPIGGVARLERIPEEPRQELLIALAGPAVTLAIILAAGGRGTGFGTGDGAPGSAGGRGAVRGPAPGIQSAGPCLQPDPGLSARRWPRAPRAPGAASSGSSGRRGSPAWSDSSSPWRLGIVGVMLHAPLTMLVAFFIFLGAGTEASAVAAREAGRGLQVAQMMVTDFRTIPIHATLAQAVDLLLAGEQREFPVVDNLGRTEGILTRDNLIRGLSRGGPDLDRGRGDDAVGADGAADARISGGARAAAGQRAARPAGGRRGRGAGRTADAGQHHGPAAGATGAAMSMGEGEGLVGESP